MIAVVADDLTGAAEIAGLGFNCGLRVEITTRVMPSTADMVVIATNTRSLSRQQAYSVSVSLAQELKALDYAWLYKKTDSVLRGHVLAELQAMIEAGVADNCLLVPANPALARTIRDGIYYIHDKPLTETDFVNDPGYAKKTAAVMELLGSAAGVVTRYLRAGSVLPPSGISLGEACTAEHLAHWAGQLKPGVLAAGAANFFTAIIDAKIKCKDAPPALAIDRNRGNVLIVCGSAFKKDRSALQTAVTNGAQVCGMPGDVFYANDKLEVAIANWAEQIQQLFRTARCVILEINQPLSHIPGIATHICAAMAKTVARVLPQLDDGDLYIEGGDTAFAILREAGYTAFSPIAQIAQGVICLEAAGNPGLYITLKVGSYLWPENIFAFGSR